MKFEPTRYICNEINELVEHIDDGIDDKYTEYHDQTLRMLSMTTGILGEDINKVEYGSIKRNYKAPNKSITYVPDFEREVNIESIQIEASKEYYSYNLNFYASMSMGNAQIYMKDFDALVLIDDPSDTKRGIYYISIYHDSLDYEYSVRYYDGETLDALKKVYKCGEDLLELLSYKHYGVEKEGFEPDFTTTFDGHNLISIDTIFNAFKKGSKDAFDSWIDKIKEQENDYALKKTQNK